MILVVKNPPANAEDVRDMGKRHEYDTWVQSLDLDGEGPLKEGMVTHCGILA